MTSIFTSGTTLTITATFTNGGTLANLDAPPTVKLYANDQTTVIGTPGTASFVSTGVYSYILTLTATTGSVTYYIEFAGTSSGKAVAGRQMIIAEFNLS